MNTSFDVIVIGVGSMGSAACWHLADRGARVLGLEQFSLAHDRGSAHGESRIIRQAYFEHPDYVPLLLKSYDLWNRLEESTGSRLFERGGLLMEGAPEGPTIDGARRSAERYAIPVESLSASEAHRRWPQFRIPDAHVVLFEPGAGLLRVEECVRAQVRAAQAQGAVVQAGERVLEWESNGTSVSVQTDKATYSAGALVITAGAWAGSCLTDLNLPLVVLRKFVAWFGIRNAACRLDQGMPTYFFELPYGAFYGFPSLDGQTAKVAEHSGGQMTTADSVERTLQATDLEPLTPFVAEHLPCHATTLQRHSVCLYTMTADQHFILDRHPRFPNVSFAAGFSGHGFKFAPVIGLALTDLALQGTTDLPVQFLSRTRLGLASAKP